MELKVFAGAESVPAVPDEINGVSFRFWVCLGRAGEPSFIIPFDNHVPVRKSDR